MVEKPYEYTLSDGSCSITIPVGFLTDGSSGGPDVGVAWLFHDYLYATHMFSDGTQCTREDADSIMADILRADNMLNYHRIFVWLYTWNLCYCFSRAWASSGKRGPNFLEELASQ